MKYRTSEQRKDLIIRFLQKHPLSTIREISDNYDGKSTNYSTVKKDVARLLEENKISSFYKTYFVNPILGQELDFLKTMIRSDKILLPRFGGIVFDEDNGIDKVTFEQNVRNAISLFHLKLKIHFLEQSRQKRKKLSWAKKQSLAKKFQSSFLKFLNTYSDMDAHVGFLRTSGEEEVKKDPNWKKPVTLQESLKRFSNFLGYHNYYDRRKFAALKSHRISIDEEIERMKRWIITGHKTAAAEHFKIRNKAFQKSLGDTQTIGKYQINDAMIRQLAEEGQDANSLKVFSLVFYGIAKQIIGLPTKKKQNQARKKFKAVYGHDIFEFVDPRDFDTS